MARNSLLIFMASVIGISISAQAQTHSTPATQSKSKSLMRIAAAQPSDRTLNFRLGPADALDQVEKTFVQLEKIVQQAAQSGCDALAFPEDTLGLLKWISANPKLLAQVVPEAVRRMLDHLGSAAAKYRMYLVCCNDVLDTDGTLRNTAFLLGRDGKIIGRYFKVQPTISESRKRGDTFPVFPTSDLGGIGMLICYDMVFPESARCLALGGADVIFNPTLGGAAIGDEDISRAAFRTRAVENFVYIVVSQRETGSMIISPQGKVLAEAKGPDHIAFADINPFAGREGGDSFNQQKDMRSRLFRERNPAAYGMLIDPNPPVLLKVPATITRQEATRIFEKGLTIGEDEFSAADSLARAGKMTEAIAAFRKLQAEYKGSWIDRLSAKRLEKLAAKP
jgi:5-aminopentanamidase